MANAGASSSRQAAVRFCGKGEMFLGYDPLEKADSLARASSLRFDGIHLRYGERSLKRKSCALSINAHFRHYRERDVEHHRRKRRTSLHAHWRHIGN
jgi:hypothetical protein